MAKARNSFNWVQSKTSCIEQNVEQTIQSNIPWEWVRFFRKFLLFEPAAGGKLKPELICVSWL